MRTSPPPQHAAAAAAAAAAANSPAATAARFRKCSVKFTEVETKTGKLGKKFSTFTMAIRMGKTTWTLEKR